MRLNYSMDHFVNIFISRIVNAYMYINIYLALYFIIFQPVFMKETPDCIYMFEWRTPLACPPFKPVDCTFK